jgi:hypothetical protein
MKSWIFRSFALLAMMKATTTEGASIYSATDLGAGVKYQADPDGSIHAVATADGRSIYAFDKSPVTPINLRTDYTYPGHQESYSVATLQKGAHRAGYTFAYIPTVGDIYYPSFKLPYYHQDEWFMRSDYSGNAVSPVTDINIRGQMIGISQFVRGDDVHGTYAAFSNLNGESHGSGSSVVDNLNTYIDPIPGVSLTSALKIDDLGRILAEGSDGHDYLLTPAAIGTAETVPEPTTMMLLGLAGSSIVLRKLLR